MIDRKFKITAVCHAHGHTFTEQDGVFFKAGDAALTRNVMDAYKRECIALGADSRQIACIDLLTARIERFKGLNPEKVKVPDVGIDEAIYTNAPNDP